VNGTHGRYPRRVSSNPSLASYTAPIFSDSAEPCEQYLFLIGL
jgi:hypothetical protein